MLKLKGMPNVNTAKNCRTVNYKDTATLDQYLDELHHKKYKV